MCSKYMQILSNTWSTCVNLQRQCHLYMYITRSCMKINWWYNDNWLQWLLIIVSHTFTSSQRQPLSACWVSHTAYGVFFFLLFGTHRLVEIVFALCKKVHALGLAAEVENDIPWEREQCVGAGGICKNKHLFVNLPYTSIYHTVENSSNFKQFILKTFRKWTHYIIWYVVCVGTCVDLFTCERTKGICGYLELYHMELNEKPTRTRSQANKTICCM